MSESIIAGAAAVPNRDGRRSCLSRRAGRCSSSGPLLLVASAWGLSSGGLQIQSGDSTVGGTKAYLTSEFAVSQQFAILTLLFYGFFIAVSAGMTVIQDGQWRLEELLHATPLRPREYIWAKFAAVLAGCLIILGIHLAAMVFFNHVMPNAKAQEIRGPLLALNYLKPALLFAVPMIVFLASVSFAVGEWTRRPVLVFLLPVAVFLGDGFFLWEWSPGWLDPRINDLLMWVDPSGWRWLNETWLKVDRGSNVLQHRHGPARSRLPDQPARPGRPGIGGRGPERSSSRGDVARRHLRTHSASSRRSRPIARSVRLDSNPAGTPGLAGHDHQPARSDRGCLASRAGGARRAAIQPWTLHIHPADPDPDDRHVAGGGGCTSTHRYCSRRVPSLSARWEPWRRASACSSCFTRSSRSSGNDRPGWRRSRMPRRSVPARSYSAKVSPLATVALTIAAATALGGVIVLLIQQKVGVELRPFLLVWGLLLMPTVLVWIGLVMALHAITQSRYTTYAVGLAVLWFTGYRLLTNQINWVGNWPLWSAVRWSDISVLELDRTALILSRLFATSLAVFLVVLTLAFFRRRDWDAIRVVHRPEPAAFVPRFLATDPLGGDPPLRRHLARPGSGLGGRGRSGQETRKGLLA